MKPDARTADIRFIIRRFNPEREMRPHWQEYRVKVRPGMTVLEALQHIREEHDATLAWRSSCRMGVCGSCGMVINGEAHGPMRLTTTCQLHMRHFKDGDKITIEPWRSAAFPVLQDLVVDRSAFDRVIEAGGYVSVNTGEAPEANSIPVPKENSDAAFDAATCIGCGACVAQCPNGAAQLFVSAKIAHLGLLPQGQTERFDRVLEMVAEMERQGFGACSNFRECEAVCPKGISIDWIARMNRDFLRAKLKGRQKPPLAG